MCSRNVYKRSDSKNIKPSAVKNMKGRKKVVRIGLKGIDYNPRPINENHAENED